MATATMEPKVDRKAAIKTLLGQLAKNRKDQSKSHSIRMKLRKLGHKGGLRAAKKSAPTKAK
jgi:hypothetical protein